jgi:hypothetical protein
MTRSSYRAVVSCMNRLTLRENRGNFLRSAGFGEDGGRGLCTQLLKLVENNIGSSLAMS